MQIVLEQFLPVDAEHAWPFICEPDWMNTWSLAFVREVAPGDGGQAGSVGAMREVTIRALGREIQLEEVIERARAPHSLVYRVVGGVPLRFHRGEITLTPERAGTHLRWQVDFESPVPGVDGFMRFVLEKQLRQSLEKLAQAVRQPVLRKPPVVRHFEEPAPSKELWAHAAEILEKQRTLASRLEDAGDPKQWFARVYAFVTEEQLALCRSGEISHPAWVLRIIPRFHDYYAVNLQRWLGLESGVAEAHWRSAFRAMEQASRWYGDPLTAITYGLAKGVQAHIEEDLPRALADVFVEHYAGKCSFARFRADYLLMGNVFRRASQRMLERMPSRHFPMVARVMTPWLPPEGKDAVIRRRFYDIPRERRRAFERGERLAAWLLERASVPVRATMTA